MTAKTAKAKKPAQTPEERQAKVDAALADLHRGVEGLRSSEAWTGYLRFQAKFHRYSFGNTILIMLQHPEATHVAGFRAWQTKHKRNVRKGEKGIKILAPLVRKVEDEKTGETRTWVSGFRIEHVWDISQTDGEPVPENPAKTLTDGDGDEALRAALVAQIEAAGFAHSLGDGRGAYGYTDFLLHEVVVGESLPLPQRVKTTAHELAHVLLHDPKDPDVAKIGRGQVEVEAESVAYIVLHYFGFDAGDYSFGYVAGWGQALDPEDRVKHIQDSARRVQRAAAKIIENIEKGGE
jgi:DNA primase